MFLDVCVRGMRFFDEDAGMAARDYPCSQSHDYCLQYLMSASPPAVSSECPVERGHGGAWRRMKEEEGRDGQWKRNIYHWFHWGYHLCGACVGGGGGEGSVVVCSPTPYSRWLMSDQSPVVGPEVVILECRLESVPVMLPTHVVRHPSSLLPSSLSGQPSLVLAVSSALHTSKPRQCVSLSGNTRVSKLPIVGVTRAWLEVGSASCVAQSEVRLLALETPESVVLVSALKVGLSWFSGAPCSASLSPE